MKLVGPVAKREYYDNTDDLRCKIEIHMRFVLLTRRNVVQTRTKFWLKCARLHRQVSFLHNRTALHLVQRQPLHTISLLRHLLLVPRVYRRRHMCGANLRDLLGTNECQVDVIIKRRGLRLNGVAQSSSVITHAHKLCDFRVAVGFGLQLFCQRRRFTRRFISRAGSNNTNTGSCGGGSSFVALFGDAFGGVDA